MNARMSEVLEELPPAEQATLRGMIAKANLANPLVQEVLAAYSYNSDLYNSLTLEERRMLLPLTSWNKDKFAAKLSFDQRCSVLALRRAGITRELLSRAFKVDPRTISHIYNPDSANYKNVREEELRLGRERFRERYMPQSVIDHVMSFRQGQELKPELNNQNANRKAGPHTVRGKGCDYDHRVVIAWKNAGEQISDQGDLATISGWYFNDLDGDWPDQWINVDNKSMRTSDTCYVAMLKDITDRTS